MGQKLSALTDVSGKVAKPVFESLSIDSHKLFM